MIISDRYWKTYISDLRKLSDRAAEEFTAYLLSHDISTREGRNAALEYGAALVTKYGEGASEKACQMYDAVAERTSKRRLPPAEPATTPSLDEVAKAIQGTMKYSERSDVVGKTVGRLVKQTGVDTTMKNAIRDGAEWAWIPNGDTCAFCLTLASRGWQPASKKMLKNGHAEHVHANCDCTFAVRMDGVSTVEGYDPDALMERYYGAEGVTPTEKINYLRRQQYAANAEAIREQKRAAYARRKVEFSTKAIDNNEIAAFLSVRVENSINNIEERNMLKIVEDATKRYPEKVTRELDKYTVILGSKRNACDTINKIIYLGKDVNIYAVDHEVGHVIESMMDQDKLHKIKLDILNGKTIDDYDVLTRVNSERESHTILVLRHKDFITEYQGRIYSEGLDDLFEIIDDYDIIAERMWELVSETYPYYMGDKPAPNRTIQSIYSLIEEVR